jgi:hypothetical protein
MNSEGHWRESYLVGGNGGLIWHQYMEFSS